MDFAIKAEFVESGEGNSSGFHGGFIGSSRSECMLDTMENQTLKENSVKPATANLVKGLALVALGLTIAAAGIYVGETDDAPGAALLGLVVMGGLVVLGVKTALRKV